MQSWHEYSANSVVRMLAYHAPRDCMADVGYDATLMTGAPTRATVAMCPRTVTAGISGQLGREERGARAGGRRERYGARRER